MSWRLSPGIVSLTKEVDDYFPGRSKRSDGTIGDLAHQSRKSDHNPDKYGVVHARDFTEHDPDLTKPHDDVAYMLCEGLRKTKDKRVKYMISRGRICSGHLGPSPWVWRPYRGPNGHFHHAHISDQGMDGRPWNIFEAIPHIENRKWIGFARGATDAALFAKGGQQAECTEVQELLLWLSVKYKKPELDPKGVDGKFFDNSAKAMAAAAKWMNGFRVMAGLKPYKTLDSNVDMQKLNDLRGWAWAK